MTIENNNKILIGSVIQGIDKSLVTGHQNKDSIILFEILISKLKYCVDQYNLGKAHYFPFIKALKEKIDHLKYKCPEICIYKNRLVFLEENTAPIIDDNIIEMPISNNHQNLNYSDVIFNYRDQQNDLISQIVILSKDSTNSLLIGNNPVELNNIYSPNVTFNSKYLIDDDTLFLIKNGTEEPCTGEIISVNKTEFLQNAVDKKIIDIHNNGKTIFQGIENSVDKLPNDSIIYIHIDTSSLAQTDRDAIANVVLNWWADFQINNPSFEGSLVINTVPHSQISNDYATGRDTNTFIPISNGNLKSGGVENWLENPVEGLLRQAYKEGENIFNEQEFLTWIEDKSLIVLSFIDETHSDYHGVGPTDFNSVPENIYQPTPSYVEDYNNFISVVRPRLKFFKGVLYPIIRVGGTLEDNFQLHSLAAIEGKILTQAEIDTAFGPDKVAAYGPSNMQTKFYDKLTTLHPYVYYNRLKENGWEGNFTKTTPAEDVFNSQEFADELNDILTDTTDVQVTVLTSTEIDSENLGEFVDSEFTLKVRDNNPRNPLFSAPANITLRYVGECEETPECDGEEVLRSTSHDSEYIFDIEDFTTDLTIDKIKITGLTFLTGFFKFYNLTVTNNNLPLIILREDIENGHLKYVPDSTNQNSENVNINYNLAFSGKHNYCTNENVVTIVKNQNGNLPPEIIVTDINLEVENPSSVTDVTIDATVNYIGTGSYNIFWQKISGPNSGFLVDTSVEDLVIQNLAVGTYTYQITVVTVEDNFNVSEEVVVTVSAEENTAPTVDDGILTLNSAENFQTLLLTDFNFNIFTQNFTDENNDNPETVRITSLPTTGELTYLGTPITLNYEFNAQDASLLTYRVNNIKKEVDGYFVYSQNLDTEMQNLESQGYTLGSYANGVYTYNKLSSNLLPSGIDGTFDTVTGSSFYGNSLTGAGWQNGYYTADAVSPNTTGPIGRDCPPSPQGGTYAGAICEYNSGVNSLPLSNHYLESFYTEVSVETGKKYKISFWQTFCGDDNAVTLLGETANWKFSLDGVVVTVDSVEFQGFGNQTWVKGEAVITVFTPTKTNAKLEFWAGPTSNTDFSVQERRGYLGIDDIQFQELLTDNAGDQVTIVGQPVPNIVCTFKISDDNSSNKLFSNDANITIE